MPTIAAVSVPTSSQREIGSRNCFVSNRAVYTEQFQVNYSASNCPIIQSLRLKTTVGLPARCRNQVSINALIEIVGDKQ